MEDRRRLFGRETILDGGPMVIPKEYPPATCRRWVTTNQEEYQNPAVTRVNRNIDSMEFDRYDACMERKKYCEEELRAKAREMLCNQEQEENREPVHFPTDSHIDEGAKCKPPWCRCLATGDPKCYEEDREEKATDDLCYCKQIYNQMHPTPDKERQKVYSSTYFIDYRDPDYKYNESRILNKEKLEKKFQDYKLKADAEDEKKQPKILPPPPEEEDRVDPNCLGLYDSLPPEKRKTKWKPDESWWRDETSECVKKIVKNYIYTSTYREMNKDGAPLPVLNREIPETSLETPGDKLAVGNESAPCTMLDIGENFQKWDRPQIRPMANRHDTISNRPCLEYDTYFKDQILHRAKYARCTEYHDHPPSAENMELARADRLRIPYDKMPPGYTGFTHSLMVEVPPVCKVKKPIDLSDPDDCISTYQLDFMRFPKEVYEAGGFDKSFTGIDFTKYGITGNPICALSRTPLPRVHRLSCYLECNKKDYPPPQQTCGGKLATEIVKMIPCENS